MKFLEKLLYDPVLVCLLERTRNGSVVWEKNENSDYTMTDGGMEFTLTDHWSYLDHMVYLTGMDLETREKVYYKRRGASALYNLISEIDYAPIDARRTARVNKYLQENC